MSTIRVFAPLVKMAAAVARRPTPDLSATVRRGTRGIPVETQVNWSESATDGKLLLLLLLLLLSLFIYRKGGGQDKFHLLCEFSPIS